MKKLFIIVIVLSSFSRNFTIQINAQETNSFAVLPVKLAEKIDITTDRSLYSVKEKIFFSAKYSSDRYIEDYHWSNILYVELIRWNGDKIVQAKFSIKENIISGFLDIPEDVKSGNYYLRAYTKWMRNYSNTVYSYINIKIVNPFTSDIDNGPEEGQKNLISAELSKENTNSIDGVRCVSPNNIYKTRQKVDLDIILDKNLRLHSDQFSITVAKNGTIDTSHHSFSGDLMMQDENASVKYLPEIRGASVTGLVLDKTTKEPLENIFVRLSIPVIGSYFSVYNTNTSGEFYFTLPELFGIHDFYIDIDPEISADAEILINSDFCNEKVNLPFTAFTIEEDEMELIKELMINEQIDNIFIYPDPKQTDLTENFDSTVFYGSTKLVYNTKKYIELPNLGEFFFEIVNEVLVVFNKDGNTLKIANNSNRKNFSPIVLIDNIPVYNIDDFLKTSLKKIDRVEVINNKYIVGSKFYNGLISVYSKKKDFAGIDLNPNSIFFSYNLLRNSAYKFPDYSNTTNNSRIPDNRNLLYWQPDIKLSDNQKKSISFFTSDEKGDYIVYVRNLNSDNQMIYGTFKFKVE